MADFTTHFRNQDAWLDRRRAEALHDLAEIERHIGEVADEPARRDRTAMLLALMQQASGAFAQLAHIDQLEISLGAGAPRPVRDFRAWRAALLARLDEKRPLYELVGLRDAA